MRRVLTAVLLLATGCATPASGPATAPPASAPPALRVVEVALRANPPVHPGPCPATIRFTGRISTVGGGGTVAYRFVRSDGVSGPVESVAFPGPASRDVTTTWSVATNYEGWAQLLILQPQDVKSSRAGFTVSCP